MNPYSYSKDEPHFNLQLKETTRRWLRYAVDFPTAHPTRYKEHATALGEYYQPRKADNAPLAILVHGVGDTSLMPCKLLTRTLIRRGIACFILRLVFHSSRMPEEIRNRMPALTPEEWFEGYRISVIDIRRVTDWASSRPELNEEKIAVLGISLGGFISAITMGIDERIKAGVFMVMGGNSFKIGRKSIYRIATKMPPLTESQYNQIQSSYALYIAEVAEKGFENVAAPIESFLMDPMTFAHYLKKRPVLMVNARWDEAVPREATLDFWKACDKPAIAWFPTFHGTIWFLYPLIGRKVASFLSSTFKM